MAMIDFKRPDGSTCKGYLAEAGKGKPGIVVIQEWWGLNDQICGTAAASPTGSRAPATMRWHPTSTRAA